VQSNVTCKQLEQHAASVRRSIITMLEQAGSGHTAGALGLADIMTALYFAVLLGFFFSCLSVLYIPYVIFAFINGSEISGWASLIMTIVFFGGLQLIILGIIGIYIGKIFKQTKERPSYIIQEENL